MKGPITFALPEVLHLLHKCKNLEGENGKLRAEVDRLRMENDILKERDLAYYEKQRKPILLSVSKNGVVA